MNISPSKKITFEIIAVLLTAIGKFLFYDLWNQRLLFILIMFCFWGIYITRRVKISPGILKEWGFRLDTFREVFITVLPFGLFALVACIIVGYYQESINLHWHLIPILILYPLFGTLQQFLLMALVAGNLQNLNRLRNSTIIILTSVLFGLLHYPYWWLVLGTFILSLFYAHIYLKKRNLFVLGIFHGWLGGIFYFTVVNKDPFLEVFGPLLQ